MGVIVSISPRMFAMRSASCSAETAGRYALIVGLTAGGAGAGFAFAFALPFAPALPLLASYSLDTMVSGICVVSRTFVPRTLILALPLVLRLLKVVYTRVHVSTNAIIDNEVVPSETTFHNSLVLLFRDNIKNLAVLLNLQTRPCVRHALFRQPHRRVPHLVLPLPSLSS